MTHSKAMVFVVVKYLLLLPVSAWLWERASRCYLDIKPGALAYLARLVLFWAGCCGPLWIGDENILLFLAAYGVIFLLCYRGSAMAKLTVCTVLYLLMVGVGTVADTIYRELPSNTWDWLTIGSALSKLLAALAVYGVSRRLNPAVRALQLPLRLWGLCALLGLAPLMMLLSFSLWNGFGRAQMAREEYRIAYTVLPFIFLSALALLAALTVLSRHEELEQAAQLAELRELYYKGLQDKETQVRALRHDLRNHMAALQGLLDAGELNKAQGYLAELSASPALYGARRICENELANVVLTNKVAEMERQGITVDTLVTLPQALPIAKTDLCALLGNALDNAAEAAAAAQDRRVRVRLRADRGMLMLQVENTFAQPPAKVGGHFVTTKADRGAHGFGLRGMQEIAARYGGTLEAAVQDNQFELVACLPLPAGGDPVQKN